MRIAGTIKWASFPSDFVYRYLYRNGVHIRVH